MIDENVFVYYTLHVDDGRVYAIAEISRNIRNTEKVPQHLQTNDDVSERGFSLIGRNQYQLECM